MIDQPDPSPVPRTSGSPSLQSEPAEPVLGLPLDRAASMLREDLLQGGEVIILLLKPSVWYIVLSSLESLGVIAIVTAAMLWVQRTFNLQGYNTDGMIGLAIGLAMVRLIWQFLEWMSRTYVLTDRRIISIEGVIRVQVFQTELRSLQHMFLLFSLRERLFGLGTISFSTAGSDLPAAYWVMVRRPIAVQRKITQAINRYR